MSVNRVALAALSLVLAACIPPANNGSSSARVDRGELYRPGKTPYDEYFGFVHDLQVEMAGVPDDRRAARSTLTQSLGLLPTVPTDRMVDVLRDRADDVRKSGGRFVLTGTMATAEGKTSADAKTIAQGLSSCLGGEKQIADRVGKMPDRAGALLQQEGVLEPAVDNDFPVLARGQVKSEMAASKRALAQIADAARASTKSSLKLIDDLSKAAAGRARATSTGTTKPTGTATTPPDGNSDFNP